MNHPPPTVRAMRDVVLEGILDAMRQEPDIVFLAADFGSPVLDRIRAECPRQFLNVGIAEQNLINVATGLALEGRRVIAYAIAPFITMRCYEQIRVNLGILGQLRPLNVTLVGVGAGCSYTVSGPTHQCFEDLSIMRALPQVELYSPADPATAAALLPGLLRTPHARYLRLDAKPLPNLGAAAGPSETAVCQGFRVLHEGTTGVCVAATGYMVHVALKAARELGDGGPTVVDCFNLTSADPAALAGVLGGHRHVVTLEEGFVNAGGLDAMVLQLLHQRQLLRPTTHLGMQRRYSFALGSRDHLLSLHEADPAAVAARLRTLSEN